MCRHRCCWLQVDFVKLLMDKLRYLHTKYMDTPLAPRFPRPAFKVRDSDRQHQL
jgi:hypothetical protein